MKNLWKNIELVIFDMDGLLLDTEKVSHITFKECCILFGEEFNLKLFESLIGRNNEDQLKILNNFFSNNLNVIEFDSKWKELFYIKLKEHVPVKKGIIEFLEMLNENDLNMVVATSTKTEIAERHLTKAKIRKFFSAIIGGDMIKNGKPKPDIYKKVLDNFSKNPSDCLVFEDSTNGVISALNADLKVIHIPDYKKTKLYNRKKNYYYYENLKKFIHKNPVIFSIS